MFTPGYSSRSSLTLRFFRVTWFTPVLLSYVVVGILWTWIYNFDWGAVNLGLAVDVEYTPAERGCPTRFDLVMKMPAHLDEEQIEKLKVIAAKCPVHRTLEGEVMFEERVELA